MAANLQDIFKKQIAIESKVRSIRGVFFNEDNLRLTNYCPSYQRNYVWDDEKASYFIESIFLGTEIPPLIFFKFEEDDETHNEIVDGRQRYQSILRFVKGDLKLKKSGLQRLSSEKKLIGKSYKELDDYYKSIFEDTKIRVIEYRFLTDHSAEDEDNVKKEIFQRYNTGITPLKNDEIDSAEYYYNDLNSFLKDKFKEDESFNETFCQVFRFSREKSTVDQKAMKLRELLVQYKIPIKYYAVEKQKVIKKYFDLLTKQINEDNIEEIWESSLKKLKLLSEIESHLVASGVNYNRLYGECFFWALSVVEEETGEPVDSLDNLFYSDMVSYFKDKEDVFTTTSSSFTKILVGRYETTAKFFGDKFDCSFELFINNNDTFKQTNKTLTIDNSDINTSLSFDDLRINKPEPTSVEVVELLRTVRSSRFLIRPPYQRKEVINRRKSSSIIESLLLGIKLPPIFVYKREDGTFEVIDGQQRLLSILAFMGEPYKDEKGKELFSKQNCFSLDLKDNGILKDLHGRKYSDLNKTEQGKIKSADIWVIEIDGRRNKNFDPVDLFVRLNNKPYPIAKDSFEMWNSFAPRPLINSIKVACNNNRNWFYLRKTSNRMEDENLFTTLAYFQYEYQKCGIPSNDVSPAQTIELYKKGKQIACRFRVRHKITEIIEQVDSTDFIKAINLLEFGFLRNVRTLLGDKKETSIKPSQSLDDLLRFERGRRTQMMFYILWVLLHDLSHKDLLNKCQWTRAQIGDMIDLMKACDNVSEFKQKITAFRNQFKEENGPLMFKLSDVAEVISVKEESIQTNVHFVLDPIPEFGGRFSIQYVDGDIALQGDHIGIRVKREGIEPQYIGGVLHSSIFRFEPTRYTPNQLGQISIPFVEEDSQECVGKTVRYIDQTHGLERNFFERILDLLVYEIIIGNEKDTSKLSIYHLIAALPDIRNTNDNDKKQIIYQVYNQLSRPDSDMSLCLLKAVDMDIEERINSILY